MIPNKENSISYSSKNFLPVNNAYDSNDKGKETLDNLKSIIQKIDYKLGNPSNYQIYRMEDSFTELFNFI